MKIHLGRTAHVYTIATKKMKLYSIPKKYKNFKTDMFGNYETDNNNLIRFLLKNGYEEVIEKNKKDEKNTKKKTPAKKEV